MSTTAARCSHFSLSYPCNFAPNLSALVGKDISIYHLFYHVYAIMYSCSDIFQSVHWIILMTHGFVQILWVNHNSCSIQFVHDKHTTEPSPSSCFNPSLTATGTDLDEYTLDRTFSFIFIWTLIPGTQPLVSNTSFATDETSSGFSLTISQFATK